MVKRERLQTHRCAFQRHRRQIHRFLQIYHATGRYTRKTLPCPVSLSTRILPPCSSTIFETIAKPKPDTARFGCEERVENILDVFLRDTGAAVKNADFRDIIHAVAFSR